MDITNTPLQLQKKNGEVTFANNTKSDFIEIIDDHKNIAIIGSFPHPDMKAILSVIDKKINYKSQLFILSNENDIQNIKNTNEKFDLVIYHQLPNNKNIDLLKKFDNISKLIILGSQTDMTYINNSEIINIDFSNIDFDEANAVFNENFEDFNLSESIISMIENFPPIEVPFGKYNISPRTKTILYQKIGSVKTKKPLLIVKSINKKKEAILLGSGLWRWKYIDFAENKNNIVFNELVNKLLLYLTSSDDKRKFRLNPSKKEYIVGEDLHFDAEIYNNLYEEVFGYKINLKLTNNNQETKKYEFTTSNLNSSYKISGLNEGIYNFEASTSIDGKNKIVKGQLLIKDHSIEMKNFTADSTILRQLSKNSDGKFFKENEINKLKNYISEKKAIKTIHYNENITSIINFRILLPLFLLLIGSEWFLRKYNGAY